MHISEERLICSECVVAPEIIKKEGYPDMARCPLCGVHGDLEVVREAAAEYQKEKLLEKYINSNEASSILKSIASITYDEPSGPIPAFILKLE